MYFLLSAVPNHVPVQPPVGCCKFNSNFINLKGTNSLNLNFVETWKSLICAVASSCLYGNQCAGFDYCGKSDDRIVLVSMDLVLKIAASLQNLHLGALDSITAGKGQMTLS